MKIETQRSWQLTLLILQNAITELATNVDPVAEVSLNKVGLIVETAWPRPVARAISPLWDIGRGGPLANTPAATVVGGVPLDASDMSALASGHLPAQLSEFEARMPKRHS